MRVPDSQIAHEAAALATAWAALARVAATKTDRRVAEAGALAALRVQAAHTRRRSR